MNILVFDIETAPDTDGGKKIYALDGLSDAKVAEAMFAQRRQQTGGEEFLPLHLHRIVAISALLRTPDKLKLWSLGELDAPEADIVQRFFDGIERYTPRLVSWNGGAFDLPVLHYRALLHGVQAPRYWETGDEDQSFRWNNYLNRYHDRHTDLMEVLANYNPRANAPLSEIAMLLGLPGKMGMDGGQVWAHYLDGDIEAIRNYCETDVLNTYLIFLRYELMRGRETPASYEAETERARALLRDGGQRHLSAFLEAWDGDEAAAS